MARPRQVSDEDILSAARDTFLKLGPAASTAHIADALGISQPALFKRFGSKKELMLSALCPRVPTGLLGELKRGPSDEPLRPQLRKMAEAISLFLAELSPCVMALRSSGIHPEEVLGRYPVPPPLLLMKAIADWLSKAQRLGLVRPTQPETAAMTVLGGLHMRLFMSHLAHEQAPPPFSEYADDLIETLARGLEPRRDGN